MNKYWKKAIGVVVIGAAIVGAVLVYQAVNKDNLLVKNTLQPTTASNSSSGKYKVVDACAVVTQADANALLGATATKGDTSTGNTASDDINVSTCTYTIASPLKSLTLLARSAKTANGATSNRNQFTTGLPATAQKVSGYGDAAYWDPTYGQLNILKHNNWYILSSGGLRPTDKTLDEGKAFADRIVAKL